MGGQPRTSEVLSHTLNYPANWTDLLFWQTDQNSSLVPQTEYVIKSWVQDQSNYMRLLLDTAADVFKVVVTQGPTDTTVVSVPAGSYTEQMLFKFAVVNGPGELRLHVFSPESSLSAAGPRVDLTFNEVYLGSDPLGASHAHGLYALVLAFDEPLDAAQIDREITVALGGVPPAPSSPGDMDQNGRVDLNDFATFAVCFTGSGLPAAPGCAIGDLDGDGDLDLDDFNIFASNFTQ
jgi:hypothetical protein